MRPSFPQGRDTHFPRLFVIGSGTKISVMRIVPPDEYAGAVVFLEKHGHRIQPIDSLTTSDPSAPCSKVNGKQMTAEEVVKLATDKGWVLP